jgi:hypothetical protein
MLLYCFKQATVDRPDVICAFAVFLDAMPKKKESQLPFWEGPSI